MGPAMNGTSDSMTMVNGVLNGGSDSTNLPIDIQKVAELLVNDDKVKVAGIDADGLLRGKVIDKDKFLAVCQDGFGMSTVIFGWDMHDVNYTQESSIANTENGYADLLAVPDLATFRRIPWEDNIAFFLVRFMSNGRPVHACGRSILKQLCEKISSQGYEALAGGLIFRRRWYSLPCWLISCFS